MSVIGENVQNLDISSYVSKYSGHTKVLRLQHIAEHFPSHKIEAAKLLIREAKSTLNTILYVKACKVYEQLGDPEFICDEQWIQNSDRTTMALAEQLESDLAVAKSTMVKESIRIGHRDLGNLFYQAGNLNEALKCYLRMRDFCALPRHNCDMCLSIVALSIDLGQYFNANNFLNKVTDTDGDAQLASKLRAAAGLVALHDGLFKTAALKFLEIDTELGGSFSGTISDEDVGLYGTLCALATFSRAELRRHFVEKKGFLNNFTALTPAARELAAGFIHGKYEACLQQLEALMPRLRLDLHMWRHASALSDLIAEKTLVQYFAPYSAVGLDRMAAALGLTYAQLEPRVAALVAAGRIPARIDSQARTLFRVREDSRRQMIQRVLALTQTHTATVKRDILRLSLLKHGFAVESPADGDGPVGMGGRHGRRADEVDEAAGHSQGSGGGDWTGPIANVFSFFGVGGSSSSAAAAGGSREMEYAGGEEQREVMDLDEFDDREDVDEDEDA